MPEIGKLINTEDVVDEAITEDKLADDAVTSAKIKDGEIVNADIATAAAIAYAKLALEGKIDNDDIKALAAIAYSKLATDPRICRIKTGTYTGDGTVSQGIEGIGFTPKIVRIGIYDELTNQTNHEVWQAMKNDQMYSDFSNVIYGAANPYANRLISLDSDGFTVDDAGSDAHPNKDDETYHYEALG